MAEYAVNPKTGDVMTYDGGPDWKPVPKEDVAVHPDTKAVAVFDGKKWQELPTPSEGWGKDLGRNVVTGVAKGARDIASIPHTALNAFADAADKTREMNPGVTNPPDYATPDIQDQVARMAVFSPQATGGAREVAKALPSSEQMDHVLFNRLGLPYYVPSTRLGRLGQAALEGGTAGAVAGPIGAAMGGLGGASQQGAAELGLPPWAQTAAGVGVPLLTGAGALGLRAAFPGAKKAVASTMQGVRPSDIDAASKIVSDAAAAGTNATWPEAINQVNNGASKRLLDVQRVVEQSRKGSDVLAPYMARRAPGNAMAMKKTLDTVGPDLQGQAAGDVPTNLQQAAEDAVKRVQGERSAAVKPFYKAAATDQVPVGEMRLLIDAIDSEIAKHPAAAVTTQLRTLRSDLIAKAAVPGVPGIPGTRVQSGGTAAHPIYRYQPGTPGMPAQPEIPVTSVEGLDSARKFWRDKLELPPIAPAATDSETAARAGPILSGLRDNMTRASPDFAYGKALHEQLSKDVVEPVKRSPTGTLAETPPLLPAQRPVLAPTGEQGTLDPVQIRSTVKRLSREGPTVVRDWVRMNIKSQFSEATQENIPGANQWGGPKFRAMTMGNQDQAKNLEALVTSLPNGNTVWNGYKRLMNVFGAQGKRQPPGSMTEFNKQITEDLGGGKINLQVISKVQDAVQRYRYGGNAAALAEMFTDPNNAAMWRALTFAPTRTLRAIIGTMPQADQKAIEPR